MKRFWAFFLCAALALGMIACGGQQQTDADGQQQQQEQQQQEQEQEQQQEQEPIVTAFGAAIDPLGILEGAMIGLTEEELVARQPGMQRDEDGTGMILYRAPAGDTGFSYQATYALVDDEVVSSTYYVGVKDGAALTRDDFYELTLSTLQALEAVPGMEEGIFLIRKTDEGLTTMTTGTGMVADDMAAVGDANREYVFYGTYGDHSIQGYFFAQDGVYVMEYGIVAE